MSLIVLLSRPSSPPADDLGPVLTAAGFDVIDHALGSTPAVDFEPVRVAVIDAGDRPDAAAAQTRRWRAELGDHLVPILWVLPAADPDAAVRGLDAGADAVLARPLDAAVLVAQVKALARTQATGHRLDARAGEARLLGDQLRKAYAQLDRELDMARRVQRSFLPRALPAVGAARFAVCHRPRSRAAADFYDVRQLDEHHVGFLVGDVLALGTTADSLLGVFVRQTAILKEVTGHGYQLIPPEEVLTTVNRELIALGLEDPPLVAMLAGMLDARDGTVILARAGLPAPVHLPADGEPAVWSVPGPFLGTAEAAYSPLTGRLAPGDRLIIGTDGTRPDDAPGDQAQTLLRDAAAKHRGLSGQLFVDTLANELLPHARHPDDFTVLVTEMSRG